MRAKLWSRDDATRIHEALCAAGVPYEIRSEVQRAMADLVQFQGVVRVIGRAVDDVRSATNGPTSAGVDGDA